jgi:hypothetical protein
VHGFVIVSLSFLSSTMYCTVFVFVVLLACSFSTMTELGSVVHRIDARFKNFGRFSLMHQLFCASDGWFQVLDLVPVRLSISSFYSYASHLALGHISSEFCCSLQKYKWDAISAGRRVP